MNHLEAAGWCLLPRDVPPAPAGSRRMGRRPGLGADACLPSAGVSRLISGPMETADQPAGRAMVGRPSIPDRLAPAYVTGLRHRHSRRSDGALAPADGADRICAGLRQAGASGALRLSTDSPGRRGGGDLRSG